MIISPRGRNWESEAPGNIVPCFSLCAFFFSFPMILGVPREEQTFFFFFGVSRVVFQKKQGQGCFRIRMAGTSRDEGWYVRCAPVWEKGCLLEKGSFQKCPSFSTDSRECSRRVQRF